MDFGIINLRNAAKVLFFKGANFIGIKAPASVASSYEFTLPDALPGSTQAITVDSSGNLSYTTLGGHTQNTDTGTNQNTFTIGNGAAGTKTLALTNGFVTSLQATPTANRAITIPNTSGTIALTSDFTANLPASFGTLLSSSYAIGGNVGIIGIPNRQVAITAYHGLRLGGLMPDALYNTEFEIRNPPVLQGENQVQNQGTFCVGIAPSLNNPAPNYGSPTSFGLLHIYRRSWQSGGTYINCLNSGFSSIFQVNLNGEILINNTKVVGARESGWTASTGTALKASFVTSTATLEQCAQRIKALEDTLRTHGLIN
jgi:hypothetical protein